MKNIVLIVADDMRADLLDCMPQTLALLSGGTRFVHCLATTPLCCPSRASILTGKYARRHNVKRNNEKDNFPAQDSLSPWLNAAGYYTIQAGKYLNGYNYIGVPSGWDEWHAFKGQTKYYDYDINDNGVVHSYQSQVGDYSTDKLRTKVLSAMNQASPPFFLYFCPKAPHAPSTPAPRHQGLSVTLPAKPVSYNVVDQSHPPWVASEPVWFQGKIADTDDTWRKQIRTLLALDDAIAAIFDQVVEMGLLADTVFIFTSDGGLQWGEHRLTGKNWPYEETIHAPLLIRQGWADTPAELSQLVGNIDLAPTILDYAGLPSSGDGASLRPLLDGGSVWRDAMLVENWQTVGLRPYVGVRGESYTYVEYDTGEREYYDLAFDPYQLVNVFGTHPGVPAAQQKLAELIA